MEKPMRDNLLAIAMSVMLGGMAGNASSVMAAPQPASPTHDVTDTSPVPMLPETESALPHPPHPPPPPKEMAKPVEAEDYLRAFELAKAGNLPVLVIFGSPQCPPCLRLRHEVLNDPTFRNDAGELVFVEIDASQSQELAREFSLQATPTIFLISPDGVLLNVCEGYMDTGEILRWLSQGADIAQSGDWYGTGLTALPDNSSPAQILSLLGSPDPARRRAAMSAAQNMGASGEKILLEGLSSPWLAVRLGAEEALRELFPVLPIFDPWAAAPIREETAGLIAGALNGEGRTKAAERGAEAELSPRAKAQLERALLQTISGSILERTRGMCGLVSLGKAALPEIMKQRLALQRAGQLEASARLDMVVWRILIPHQTEQRARARNALAREDGAKRRAAISRLGEAGIGALAALQELAANDADPLARETALTSLRKLGGEDALAAVAAQLASAESNLRLIAVTELGESKGSQAAKVLETAICDPDEEVACAAIAGLEKLEARESAESLKNALGDSRWRVRAEAARVAGKLNAKALSGTIEAMLEDEDNFVVAAAFTALREMKTPPKMERIVELALGAPGLIPLVCETLADLNTDESFSTLLHLFATLPPEQHLSMMSATMREFKRWEEPPNKAKELFHMFSGEMEPKFRNAWGEELVRLRGELLRQVLHEYIKNRVPADSVLPLQAAGVSMQNWDIIGGYLRLRQLAETLNPNAPTKGSEIASATGADIVTDDENDSGHATSDHESPDASATAEAQDTQPTLSVRNPRMKQTSSFNIPVLEDELATLSPEDVAFAIMIFSCDAGIGFYDDDEDNSSEILREAYSELEELLQDRDGAGNEKEIEQILAGIPDMGAQAVASLAALREQTELLRSNAPDNPLTGVALYLSAPDGERIEISAMLNTIETLLSQNNNERFIFGDPLLTAIRVASYRLNDADDDRLKAILLRHPKVFVSLFRTVQTNEEMEQYRRFLSIQRLQELLADFDDKAEAVQSNTQIIRALLFSNFFEPPTEAASIASANEPLNALCDSEVDILRAFGYFLLGNRREGALARLVRGTRDRNEWVRYAAAHGIGNKYHEDIEGKAELELLLADGSMPVLGIAAQGLLAPHFRDLLRHRANAATFRYGRFTVAGRSYYERDDDEDVNAPALTISAERPAYLEIVRKRLAELKVNAPSTTARAPVRSNSDAADEDEEDNNWYFHRIAIEALQMLLMSYGDFSLLEDMLQAWQANPDAEIPFLLKIAFSVTRDERYLVPLEKAIQNESNHEVLRGYIRTLGNVPGDRARKLRREINRKLR